MKQTDMSRFLKTTPLMTAGVLDNRKGAFDSTLTDNSAGQLGNVEQPGPSTHVPGERFGD